MSDESIKSPSAPNNILNPLLDHLGDKIRVKFIRGCLKQDKNTYTYGRIVSIYIVYEINKNYDILGIFPALQNCLLGAV